MSETIPSPKKRIIFLNNLIWKPEQANFKFKYELLSKYYRGEMYHFSYDYDEKQAGDFTFLSLPQSNGAFRYIRYLFFVYKKIRNDKRIDYIISYDPCVFCTIGLLLKIYTGAKLVAEVNLDHFEGVKFGARGFKLKIKKWVLYFLTRLAIKHADAVKFICNKIMNDYKKRFSFKNATVFFSYISTQVFVLDRCVDNKFILCVGHPYKLKGVDVLIKAFQKITNDYPTLKLKIIGHCDDRSEYDLLAAGNPNISFQKGTEYDKIVTEFESCKMLVAPSRTEAMSRVLIEAMACGKPVIGSKVGGIPEVIIENESGLLFESENDAELAEKIRLLMSDSQLSDKLGKNALARVKTNFSPKQYVEQYHFFLKSLGS